MSSLTSLKVHVKRGSCSDTLGNRVYIPALYVLNKIDQISIQELDLIYKIPHAVPVCANHEWNFGKLRLLSSLTNPEQMNYWILCIGFYFSDELIFRWDYLSLVRVYTKPRGLAPDYSDPVVLKRDKCSMEDFCNTIHSSIKEQFKQ